MKLNAAWKNGSLLLDMDPSKMSLGYLTDEHRGVVLIDSRNRRVLPDEIPDEVDVDVYLEDGLTEPVRNVIVAALDAGYKIVARDARTWPAPRINVYMRIVPGTE